MNQRLAEALVFFGGRVLRSLAIVTVVGIDLVTIWALVKLGIEFKWAAVTVVCAAITFGQVKDLDE